MVDMCNEYTYNHNLKFSTNPDPNKSKSKCMYFNHQNRPIPNKTGIMLNDEYLPFVKQAKHLGNTIHCTDRDKDILIKRGVTIGKLIGVLQEFSFAHPVTKCSIIQKYCTSFYGCKLWNLYSNEFSKILKT